MYKKKRKKKRTYKLYKTLSQECFLVYLQAVLTVCFHDPFLSVDTCNGCFIACIQWILIIWYRPKAKHFKQYIIIYTNVCFVSWITVANNSLFVWTSNSPTTSPDNSGSFVQCIPRAIYTTFFDCRCCCDNLYSYSTHSPLSGRLTALLLHVIVNEWLQSGVLSVLFGCYMAGTTWNCCCLRASSLCTIQPYAMTRHFMQNHVCRVRAWLAVTCHLNFWQNDGDLLHAAAVTRGWNGYWNKSQHKKLTQEKKILPSNMPGLDHMTFWLHVWHSNHWAIPTCCHSPWSLEWSAEHQVLKFPLVHDY